MKNAISFKNRGNHARFVLAAKIFLSVVAVTLGVLLVILPYTNPAQKQVKLTLNPMQSDKPSVTVMSHPRFQGIDEKNQPYHVRAESATQPTIDSVLLAKPTADITLKDGKWFSLIADKGEYTPSQKKLLLTGSVDIFTGDGTEVRTEAAEADLVHGTASGTLPISVQGLPGTLTAVGFKITNQGNNLEFYKPVHVVLYPAKAKKRRRR